jgi:uncharacterized protein YjdB
MIFDPANATILDLIYHSDDESVATVDNDGLITIVTETAEQTCNITATSVYGGFRISLEVTSTL